MLPDSGIRRESLPPYLMESPPSSRFSMDSDDMEEREQNHPSTPALSPSQLPPSFNPDLYLAPQLAALNKKQTRFPVKASPSRADSAISLTRSASDVESLKKSVEAWKPTKQELFIMISLAVIALVVALDATILVAVLPTIAHALDGTSAEAFWAGTSYLLSSAVFQPVIASISDVFGRQQLLLISLFFFTLGTVFCAIANHFPMMLAGRTIQGIGGGGIITMSQVIFCDIVPLRQRPKYFAMVLASWSIGTVAGPVLGGVFTQNTTWRWVFYINFPFCGLGFLLALVFVRLNAVAKMTFAEKIRSIDWLGAFLFLGGTTAFLIGLSWGGIQYPWDSWQTLVPIIAGLANIVVFIWWQTKAPKSLLPTSIFYCPSAFAAFYSALVNGFALFTALYYLPFFFMSVRSHSPTQSGIDLFPALFLMLPGSIIVSILTTRLGRFRWAIWGGWVVSTTGAGLFMLFDEKSPKVVWVVALAVFGIGSGMVLTSVNVGIQAISKEEDCAMAACMYGFMRSLGMPIGVALSGTLFTNRMSAHLAALGLPTDIAHDSEKYVFVLRTLKMDDPHRVAVVSAYLEGFRGVWVLLVGACASALAVSVVIRRFGMDKMLVSNHSARR